MNARTDRMSPLLNQLFPGRLGRGRESFAPHDLADHRRPPVPNPNCPVERMRGVISTGALNPTRAWTSESLSVGMDQALEDAFARREAAALDRAYARYHVACSTPSPTMCCGTPTTRKIASTTRSSVFGPSVSLMTPSGDRCKTFSSLAFAIKRSRNAARPRVLQSWQEA